METHSCRSGYCIVRPEKAFGAVDSDGILRYRVTEQISHWVETPPPCPLLRWTPHPSFLHVLAPRKVRLEFVQRIQNCPLLLKIRDTEESIQPWAVRSKYLLIVDEMKSAAERPGDSEIGFLVGDRLSQTGKCFGYPRWIIRRNEICNGYHSQGDFSVLCNLRAPQDGRNPPRKFRKTAGSEMGFSEIRQDRYIFGKAG